MKTIVLDFETFYDDQFSLRRLTPVEYILDPRFETILCAVKEDGGTGFYLTPDELRAYLKQLPEKVTVISHNALFDMCILAWVFDYIPTIMVDTLGMARAWLQHKLKSLSLASVAMHYGVGIKGGTVHQVKGMGLAAIKAAGFYHEYAAYSVNDADLCWAIYRKMIDEGFPVAEIAIMDTVLRCCVKPKFQLDQNKLHEHLHDVQTSKQNLLARCGMTSRDDLMSNEKFAAALRLLDVEPPRKISLVTGNEAYAFAKTDEAFTDLEEHDNPEVQALVSARLGLKTTLEETRTQRMISISNLTWKGNDQKLLPIPLRYSGAHTHRLSGDWKLNLQNLPSRRNNTIRTAIIAPPGHTVVAVDASQIEARINAWFCGQTDLVEAFRRGEDVYSTFASEVYGYPVTKALKKERTLGKVSILGLGYNMGGPKFVDTVRLQSGGEVIIDDVESARVVQIYRRKYHRIPQMWKMLDNLLGRMTQDFEHTIGPVTFERERIRLPSGLYLNYHDLQNKNGQWTFSYAGRPKYTYGGKVLENIIQALARICVMDAAVRVRKRLIKAENHVWLSLQVHDELVYVVPDRFVAIVRGIVSEEMRRPPWWGLDIPLGSEAAIGNSFGSAK
jgi:DNA polymerase family A